MERFKIIRLWLITPCFQICYGAAIPETDESFEIKFLKNYHYLSPLKDGNHNVSDALREFQERSEIPVTGVLDATTIREMKKPRCGVPDRDEEVFSKRGRVKRQFSASDHKWDKMALTYKFINYDTKMGSLSPNKQRSIVRKAFQAWEAISPLNFTDISPAVSNNAVSVKSDITLAFKTSKHKGCSYPFDGSGGVLAHAFFPKEGDLHFDYNEKWTDGVTYGINLFSVALHEIGHLLGLRHSKNRSAIMHETYKAYDPNMKLTIEEKNGIHYIYGDGGGTSRPGSNTGGKTGAKGAARPSCTDDPHFTKYCKLWQSSKLCGHKYVRPRCKKTCNVNNCALG
ncbi:matrilysin-like [Montipora foliosa]|uniref:matrilysin-like n=1 Tax=Montipora foliosa TaxID=591990 RepID=UPI0035F165BD